MKDKIILELDLEDAQALQDIFTWASIYYRKEMKEDTLPESWSNLWKIYIESCLERLKKVYQETKENMK